MKQNVLKRAAFLSFVAFIASSSWTCGGVKGLYEDCTEPSDCPAPWVCCSKILGGISVEPTCEERDSCDADGYLPLLIEGNPCGRNASGGLDTMCRSDLICCSTTLTCAQEGQCAESSPEPPEDGSSNAACGSDKDCRAGEICCGITYSVRDGQCTTVDECKETLPSGQ